MRTCLIRGGTALCTGCKTTFCIVVPRVPSIPFHSVPHLIIWGSIKTDAPNILNLKTDAPKLLNAPHARQLHPYPGHSSIIFVAP